MKKLRLVTIVLQLATIVSLVSCSKDDPESPPTNDIEYGISGSIVGSGNDGVAVSVGGRQVSSDVNGHFEIAGLDAGSYRVTPVKSGFYFVPESREITIVDGSIADVDFEIFSEDELQYNGSSWEFFNPEVYAIKENEGMQLQLDLAENALWFHNAQGGLIYQSITGDFEIQGKVSAWKRTNDEEEVACSICLGGLMARDPDNSSGENYVHLVVGNTPEGIGVEHKSTVDGNSGFDATNDGSADFDLRIARSGSNFILSKRVPSNTDWVEVITYERADLPATLQVGFNIYTAASGSLADLSVKYDGVAITQ